MKILINEKISPHRYKDNHGYLICTDCIMARTGKQTYTRDECFGDGDSTEIEVDRPSKEVFDAKTMASFENVPITIEHPSVNVDPDNYNTLSVGHMRDIRKGTYEGQPVMVGTAVITDSEAIEKVESGDLTNLSCGYDCDIDDSDNPHQFNIRGNHIALCECPRAGITHIQDSQKINDMALSRGDAIDVCMSLGKKFIEHFHKIYSNSTNEAVNHWASEMNSWFYKAKNIKLKSSNCGITETQLRDWFFTSGANFTDFIDDCTIDEERIYDKFIRLVIDSNDVKSAVNKLFNKSYTKDTKKKYEVTLESGDIMKDLRTRRRVRDDEDWQTLYVELTNGRVDAFEYDANEETEDEAVNELVDALGEDGEGTLVAIYSNMTNAGPFGELYRARRRVARDAKRSIRSHRDAVNPYHVQGVDEGLFYEIVDKYHNVDARKLQAIIDKYNVNRKTAYQLITYYGLADEMDKLRLFDSRRVTKRRK